MDRLFSYGYNATDLRNDGNSDPALRAYLFGPFDKTTGSYMTYTGSTTATLVSRTGYRSGTNLDGTHLTFTGTTDTAPIAVDIRNDGAAYPDWNLIGNPYPTYLDMDLFLNYVVDPNTNPVTTNLSILENASGIYGYVGNGQSNKWNVITLANASLQLMTPGQGFFVAANAAKQDAYDIMFDPSMRAIGSGDDFVPGRDVLKELTYLKLNARTKEQDFTTELYFNDNASKGLDHGYDGKILGNVAPSFAIYSHLVQANTGLPMALQALHPSDLKDLTIPLGVNSNRGDQIAFSMSESTLPGNIKVYLEDRTSNTFTLLNTGDYTFTPNVDLRGTGRFYLRTSTSTLAIGESDLDNLKIYTTIHPKALIINGELKAATSISLYDIQGRLVLKNKLDQYKTLNRIDISNIVTGVYFVKVFSDSQIKTKKIIIK